MRIISQQTSFPASYENNTYISSVNLTDLRENPRIREIPIIASANSIVMGMVKATGTKYVVISANPEILHTLHYYWHLC
jgi:hypothetical protein